MINIIQNTIGALARRGLSIVRNGLKMWLPFSKSEILGEDLAEGYDFSGWDEIDITEKTANTFTSDPDGGVYKTLVEVGKTYSLTIAGTTDASGVQVRNAIDGELYYDSGATGAFSDTVTFTATQTSIYVKNKSAGAATITTLNVQEVTQIAPDISSNSNSAKLFTGKALSFDGVNDYVDFGSDINSNGTVWTTAIWISDYTRGSYDWIYGHTTQQSIGLNYGGGVDGNIFYRDEYGTYDEFSCEVFKSDFTAAKRLIFTSDGTDISLYIDGEFIDSITPTATNLELSRLMAGYNTSSFMVAATVSDFQLYNTAWTQDDVTFDYNNPQHLVTDNPASSIALSNLKGYWHLSEGNGDYAYNSAVALGSEEVSNGDFSNGSSAWNVPVGGWSVSNEQLVHDGSSSSANALQLINIDGVVGTIYRLTFDVISATNANVKAYSPNVGYIAQTLNTGDKAIYFLESDGAYNSLALRNYASSEIILDNISVKEVSVGTINGATPVLAQATIPQLGMMDWAKSTVGSDEITLVQAPNNEGYDILGNSLRLREHSLNLDGSGYAEVPDADNLDVTSTITLECWVKWNTEDGKGLLAKWGGSNSLRSYIIEKTTNGLKFKIRVDGLGTYIAESGSITGTDWKHITCVYNGSNQTIYVDSSVSGTPESNTGAINSSNTNVEIGSAEGSNYYSELIDDVRIYNRALSSDEVEQNHKAGLNKHKTGSSFSDDFSSDYGF